MLSLRRELDERQTLTIARHDTGFAASTLARDIDIRTTGTHGVIQTSLFEAGSAAGISDTVTMQMAGIFQWDIDFIQDVRVGDEFTVIYEEIWRDGVKLRNGDIVATEFVNQGKSYRAARYKLSNGDFNYFTPEGRSVRKAFIRAPVEFTRISSNFNPSRRHPVLNTIRAHRGVDYAAPSGTPVQAAGDGKIVFRGVQGGYGNAVVASARRQHHHVVRSLVALWQSTRRWSSASGRGDRLRRKIRPCDRPSLTLRVSRERRAPQSTHCSASSRGSGTAGSPRRFSQHHRHALAAARPLPARSPCHRSELTAIP